VDKSLLILIAQPSSEESEKSRKPTLYEKVTYALDCLAGDYNTKRAGKFIAEVYRCICCIPYEQQSPLQKKIMRMIIPELEMHMPHVLDSDFYMQYKQTRDEEENRKD